jgi:hypothetical protein
MNICQVNQLWEQRDNCCGAFHSTNQLYYILEMARGWFERVAGELQTFSGCSPVQLLVVTIMC